MPRQVVAVAHFESVADVAGQALQMAQIGFDLQTQSEAVLVAQIGEEVVDLRVEFEAVGTLGYRDQDIQANPLVEEGGDVRRGAVWQLYVQLVAQFHQAQGAAVEAFAQRFEQGPVFGKGTQYASGIDHREAAIHAKDKEKGRLYCKGFALADQVTKRGSLRQRGLEGVMQITGKRG
ncbi:hypothetical protein D3C78_1163700 [compost metagenome]